ncbi:signal peptidase II [Fructilactobacillus myrtifloralis]|uniref:Lipoprotein signal peptidase n=1 Tax=Fructilactobacillus myrtifloralis TaxID=2940301 RepID=A0ABY5BRX0_9LACO|nr:signal peptidase II [Fructilactobacillus myrtifloralis]USS85331.1 signal peptidase II [Fructilactobacillus myrtifloralis]
MRAKAGVRNLLLTLAGILGLILLDQLVKHWVRGHITVGGHRTVISGLLSLTNLTNSGAAWSFLAGNSWIFVIIAVGAIGVFGWFLFQSRSEPGLLVAVGLMFAGTAGNLIDRLQWGAVTDFIQLDFLQFPIFNLADCYLTIGVILLLLHLLVKEN